MNLWSCLLIHGHPTREGDIKYVDMKVWTKFVLSSTGYDLLVKTCCFVYVCGALLTLDYLCPVLSTLVKPRNSYSEIRGYPGIYSRVKF